MEDCPHHDTTDKKKNKQTNTASLQKEVAQHWHCNITLEFSTSEFRYEKSFKMA